EGGGEVRIELSCLLEECARGGHVLALQRQQPEAVRDPGILRIELSRVVERRLGEADVSLVAFDGGEIAIRIGIARMSLQHLAESKSARGWLGCFARNVSRRASAPSQSRRVISSRPSLYRIVAGSSNRRCRSAALICAGVGRCCAGACAQAQASSAIAMNSRI